MSTTSTIQPVLMPYFEKKLAEIIKKSYKPQTKYTYIREYLFEVIWVDNSSVCFEVTKGNVGSQHGESFLYEQLGEITIEYAASKSLSDILESCISILDPKFFAEFYPNK